MLRPARVLSALLVWVSMTAACSSSGPGANLATFTGDGFSFGRPSGWEGCRTDIAQLHTVAIQFVGPAGSDGVPPVVQVSNEGTERAFDHAVRFHELLLEVSPGYKQVDSEPTEVSGAKQAQLIEFTDRPPVPGPNGQLVLVHGWNLLAGGKDGNVVNLLITASDADFDSTRDTLDSIVNSLELGPTGGSSSVDQLPQCTESSTP